MRTLIFHELFECIARGLRTPFSGKNLPLRTPNCAAIEVRRAFSGALRRPLAASLHGFELQVPALRGYLSIAQPSSLSLLLCCCGCTGGAVCCFTAPLTAGGRPGPFPSSLRCCLAFSYCSSRLRFSPAASMLASRMACLERFSRGMARTYLSIIYTITYPEFITLININQVCDCAQLRTGSHRNNFPLAHPIAHPDLKCSKIFIARLHCSKKDN